LFKQKQDAINWTLIGLRPTQFIVIIDGCLTFSLQ